MRLVTKAPAPLRPNRPIKRTGRRGRLFALAALDHSASEGRRNPERALGKGASEWRAPPKKQNFVFMQDDGCSQEGCRRSKGEMGEGEGWAEENGVKKFF